MFCHLGWLGCLQVEVLCKVEVGSAWLLLFRVYTYALLVLMMCFIHSMVSSSLSVVELCTRQYRLVPSVHKPLIWELYICQCPIFLWKSRSRLSLKLIDIHFVSALNHLCSMMFSKAVMNCLPFQTIPWFSHWVYGQHRFIHANSSLDHSVLTSQLWCSRKFPGLQTLNSEIRNEFTPVRLSPALVGRWQDCQHFCLMGDCRCQPEQQLPQS